jgi:hypothetical protein
VSIRFSEPERDHIRSVLIRQKRQFGLSDDGLIEDISRQLNYELEDKLQLDRKTLERFLKNEKRTADVTVGIYKQYVESLPEPDPTYELGDAFADFFGLPDSAKERRAYMDRMVERYEGTYDVWDVTDGTVDKNKPDWSLKIKSEPHTSFLHAKEKICEIMDRAIFDGIFIQLEFEGIVVPRENELTIFMKEMYVDHEKIYVLRLVEPSERSDPNAPTAFFGNVMEKKSLREREKHPKEDLTRHYKVLAIRAHVYDDDAEFGDDRDDQNITVSDASEWEEDFEEIEEFDDTEDGSSQDEK